MKVMLLIPPSRFTKNVARDLIYGCWCKGKRIAGIQFPPVSQLTVVTVLRRAGYDAVLCDAQAMAKTLPDLIDEISRGYEAVIILTSTMTIKEDGHILGELKNANPRIKTIVYGAHPTFMPKETLRRSSIDVAIQREPEFVIRDLMDAFRKGDGSWKRIKGIAYQQDGDVILNEPYPFIEDLDMLPIPDRSILPRDIDYFNPVVKRMPFTTMFTSRGCPGRCIYCSSPPFYGRGFRFQSPERVMDEIEQVAEQGYKEVFFRDEIFTAPRSRVMKICQGIIDRGLDLTWICSARVGSVDLEMMKMMKRAGCHMIRFGVESGDQDILNNIKKNITVEETEKTFNDIHKAGLETHAHLMIGMPGETRQTIDKTIRFIKKIDPTIITVGICTPYPGTPLFQEVIKKYPEAGDGSDCDLSGLHTKAFYNDVFSDMGPRDLSKGVRRFYRSFYARPAYVYGWLRRVNSLDELKRTALAATQVFDFILRGD